MGKVKILAKDRAEWLEITMRRGDSFPPIFLQTPKDQEPDQISRVIKYQALGFVLK